VSGIGTKLIEPLLVMGELPLISKTVFPPTHGWVNLIFAENTLKIDQRIVGVADGYWRWGLQKEISAERRRIV